MAQYVDQDDREEEDDDDSLNEDPLASDQDADDDGEMVPCPFCGRSIHEDADVCPRCGNYVGATDAPRRVPLFVWVGVILGGLCVLAWVLVA